MQITQHVYSTHIMEDPNTFGAMHPGGTQIYFVGDPRDHMVVVDTGEPYRAWTRQILDYYDELGRPSISAILITHSHGDHIGGADRLQEAMNCPVRCHPKLAPRLTQRLGPGVVEELRHGEEVPAGGGAGLRALFTPGHEDDHVAYYLAADGVLFSGDTILGNSTGTVRNLRQYMASLELMAQQRPAIICPGHGQVVREGAQRVQYYINHRQGREKQVLAALAGGAATVAEIVAAVYPRDLAANLHEAAARNVRTHLDKLVEEGRAVEHAARYGVAGG
jgi:glyoxylase-like metal-dependent hydrolase (beta-lactamase superfamily II)